MQEPFPLFKGATRIPLVFGVPMVPLMVMCIVIASIAMLFGLWWYLLCLPICFIMAQVTKYDDRAFHIWWLWLDTKWRHKSPLWQASSLAKTNYSRR